MDNADLSERATLLLVDDTPDNLALLNGLLKGDYTVKVASCGEKALAIAASASPPDLILLDIIMPGMDGYEVCRRLKGDPRTKNIPVIFLTARALAEDEEKGLELGAVDYITKPISPPIVMARVRTQLALQQRNRELENARSMAENANLAKSTFVATVSHELRTPLTSIRGALALLVGDVVGDLPATAKPMLDIALRNCERLILLVNDMLDMEKIEAGKMEIAIVAVELLPLVQQALDANRAYAAEYKVDFALESGVSGAFVSVDGNRMLQVLANLLSNAARHSPAGGKVSVVVERIGTNIRVAVKDNGPGIPDEFRARIFQRFAQAVSPRDRRKGGTGLGLAISRAIVEQMGGRIGFISQPDVQTVFFVDLPETTASESPVTFTMAGTGSGHGALRETKVRAATNRLSRILYVEDEPDIQRVARLALETLGRLALDICSSGDEAVRHARDFRPQLILLDVLMPVMDGPTTLARLRSVPELAAVPVVFMTARVQPGEVARYLALGAVAVIAKPFDPLTLADEVKAIWEQCHD